MPKDIELKKNIPFILTKPAYEILLMGWVEARTSIGAGFKMQTAVESFLKYYNIPEEFWDIHCATAFVYNNCDRFKDLNFKETIKKIDQWKQIQK